MENIQSPDIVQELLTASGEQVGMWREAQAFLKNYEAAQTNGTKLMSLSETIEDAQTKGAAGWIQELDLDQSDVQTAINTWNHSAKDGDANTALQNALTQCQGQASIDNTSYNQFTQFETGLDNGINQSASDVTQTESLDVQMFEQGTVVLAQQIGQMLA